MLADIYRSEENIGFALSGGGSRGACQVGALRALTEAGIWPHILAGTSIGAVNAAWFALYPHNLDRLEDLWRPLRKSDVFPGNHLRVLSNMTRYGYLYEARSLEARMRRHAGHAHFEDCMIPCAVTAVRLSDGKSVVFDSGEIVPAVMASLSIPGVFPPYRIGDELYVDGGVLEYLPVPAVLERGATTIYAIDCGHFSPQASIKGSIVDRCSRIGTSHVVDGLTLRYRMHGRTVHVLRPELPEIDDARDFRQTSALIVAGYEHAHQYLDAERRSEMAERAEA